MKWPTVTVEPLHEPHQKGAAVIDPPIKAPEVATLAWRKLVQGQLQRITKRIGKK